MNTPIFPLALKPDQKIQIMDVGASMINEVPVYKALMDQGLAHLNAFEGDERQIDLIRRSYGKNCSIYKEFLFDGKAHPLHVAKPESGMTSLLKPRDAALKFFNGFEHFGAIEKTETVQTVTMDSLVDLPAIDFLKMDIQGAELTALQHGTNKLKDCLAIQLEVSYVCLYENQPSFGEVDVWMRSQGYVPHCFLDVKRWSIAPTVFDNNFRVPGNQLLESDIVYIKDPLRLQCLSDEALKKLIAIAHWSFKSVDLCVHLIMELQSRGKASTHEHLDYLSWSNHVALP